MRLKPDAILQQTDGHRKPPRSEPSPPRSSLLPPLRPRHAGGRPMEPRRKQPEWRSSWSRVRPLCCAHWYRNTTYLGLSTVEQPLRHCTLRHRGGLHLSGPHIGFYTSAVVAPPSGALVGKRSFSH
ncbi:hypothetical protein EYF80_040308 [Liparis tanakae]|uniref:Uncharacterized protein n=1 Tax=Liparis tanakae TaxID=230148 RepID=A0A4Z2G7C2_9TELE|nr:hypothetical protein EYF80_040308 [Liparis tanakae]